MLSIERGAPFVSDLRVQWIRAARSGNPADRIPDVIHLVGTNDDIVTAEDTKDIEAAKDVKFLTLTNTGHNEIAAALASELGAGQSDSSARAEIIRRVLVDPIDSIETDAPPTLTEDLNLARIVFVLHGIRDYGSWARQLSQQIEAEGRRLEIPVKAIPARYTRFPMGPFLLFSDRQEHVRWFMDQYTELLAQFPRAEVDFIGHSNGTYILASALQRYRTLKVRNVYFAGSVVPQRYPWTTLLRDGRVSQVRNVVAASDWVVALFPRLFEQLAEWGGIEPVSGALDIGTAGFRGFSAADPSHRVIDIEYAPGQHGTGVDMAEPTKMQALVSFALSGPNPETDGKLRSTFGTLSGPSRWLDALSNVSWVVWMVLTWVVWRGGVLAKRSGDVLYANRPTMPRRELMRLMPLGLYVVFVVAFLYSF